MVAGEAGGLVSDLTDRLAKQSRLAQVLMAVFGLAVAGAMTLPMAAGWLGLGRELPGAASRGTP